MSARRVLGLLIVLLLGGLHAGERTATAQDPSYPAWFRTMPSSGPALWAVGYARGYTDLEAGLPDAKADAYQRLRRAKQGVVTTERRYEAAPGFGTSVEGTRMRDTELPDTLRSVTYVDSLKAAGMTLVLAAWTADGGTPSSPLAAGGRAPFAERPPPWVRAGVEAGTETRRAVGRAPRYFYLETSWQKAERRARSELAVRAASKIKRLEKATDDWRHNVFSVTATVRLRRVQVRARWADEETCYVLVEGIVDEVLTE